MIRSRLSGARTGLLAVFMVTAAGCTAPSIMQDNYLTYHHDFTETALQNIQSNANRLCGQRKQVAIQTRSVCTLERCVTDFQCVNPKNPLEYDPAGLATDQL